MRWRQVFALCLYVIAIVALAGRPAAAETRKGTLVFAVESLSGQTMDPILEARPGNAIYQAPMYDSLVGFDVVKGGVGLGGRRALGTIRRRPDLDLSYPAGDEV